MLAHELAHALADQNYNLGTFIKQGRKSDDGSTARLAVMEGQATWLMSEFLARSMGQSLKDSPALVASMSSVSDDERQASFPVFDNSPLYLRLTLVFPYTKGMLFQHAVFDRDGTGRASPKCFASRRSPPSRSCIPRNTSSGVKPTEPALPDPHLAQGLQGPGGRIAGRIGSRASCWSSMPARSRPRNLAPHWRGCNFELVENKKAERVVLLYCRGVGQRGRRARSTSPPIADSWRRNGRR